MPINSVKHEQNTVSSNREEGSLPNKSVNEYSPNHEKTKSYQTSSRPQRLSARSMPNRKPRISVSNPTGKNNKAIIGTSIGGLLLVLFVFNKFLLRQLQYKHQSQKTNVSQKYNIDPQINIPENRFDDMRQAEIDKSNFDIEQSFSEANNVLSRVESNTYYNSSPPRKIQLPIPPPMSQRSEIEDDRETNKTDFGQQETSQKTSVSPMTISGGVLNSKAENLVTPIYPPNAAEARAFGMVSVNVTIDEDGNVIQANAVSGNELLRDSAVQAARSSKFRTTVLAGQKVRMSGVVVYNFSPQQQ